METNLAGIYAAGDICTHEAKLDLIATGVGEVCIAVNYAKTYIDPAASAFPGHSSDMQLPDLQS
jgi:thioredoxin reductase (NADPH)